MAGTITRSSTGNSDAESLPRAWIASSLSQSGFPRALKRTALSTYRGGPGLRSDQQKRV